MAAFEQACEAQIVERRGQMQVGTPIKIAPQHVAHSRIGMNRNTTATSDRSANRPTATAIASTDRPKLSRRCIVTKMIGRSPSALIVASIGRSPVDAISARAACRASIPELPVMYIAPGSIPSPHNALAARGVGAKMLVGDRGDYPAIDLFGPRVCDVVRPQPSLDMANRNLAVSGQKPHTSP